MVDQITKNLILRAQKNEITEHLVYQKLSLALKHEGNKKILARISQDELKHYNFWQGYTQANIKPNHFKVWRYFLIAKLFGITFGIRLMEGGEKDAQILYQKIVQNIPEAAGIIDDENLHERELIDIIDEEKLKYIGSIVLGLNDALVELTGALAGLTLALQDAKLIATTGFITGIAASFSMAASEYLATKSEQGDKHPVRASIYTGIAYVATVAVLIFPYLVVNNIYLSLAWTIANALMIILSFTFYTAVAQQQPFKKRFLEMSLLSLSVAALSFVIGLLVRNLFGIEI
ncbi:MAG: VIT1/CCC1 transporter family protein [Patescibacteria group bacterium]|jgi:VIT1/CCC1 family predicted Fe2+/Mn2+ transporter|nr:VIT1/CCC1 transporter family protein [Patescibacteria group bacterium]